MARVKSKRASKVTTVKVAADMKITFVARDKSAKITMEEPVKGNLASEMVFAVRKALGKDLPPKVREQYAPSYKGHFLALGNKNACGASNIKNLLVINGIAAELERAGVKGVITPTKKAYKAIKLTGTDEKFRATLVKQIAAVLAVLGKEAPKKFKAEAEAAAVPASA